MKEQDNFSIFADKRTPEQDVEMTRKRRPWGWILLAVGAVTGVITFLVVLYNSIMSQ